VVDIPDEITRIETPIKAFPLTDDERTALRWIGRITGGIVLVVILAIGVNWAAGHIGGQEQYGRHSFMGE
jgi:hypothetical protein